MTDNGKEILQKLDQQAKLISDQGERLYNIEKALITIAVQEEKIGNIQTQVSTLWRKYDTVLGPEGAVAKLQAQAASCPKADIKSAITGQWAAIGIIVALIGALKLWG